ncbi:MAG: glycosyltransferase family 4 protein [Lachnospiraceae bacterium]|nr:glycosyltransferase family 4 protein [Lachnospiraceae bacterium]
MRVLWVCNVLLPVFARHLGVTAQGSGGWLEGCFERLTREQTDITLAVCMPVMPPGIHTEKGTLPADSKTVLNGVTFYTFAENTMAPHVYNAAMETRFKEILADFEPDLAHVFGTEFAHTLAFANAFGNPRRLLIGLQGLCGRIADVYMADLPYSVQRGRTFRDIVRHDSLRQQQANFRKRAGNEYKALRLAMHVTGRTAFDREAASEINPEAIYHPMNETLRSVFYSGAWSPDKMEPHTIFVSQGDYPLKGLHFVLLAMPEILKSFPDAHLYVAGTSIIGNVGSDRHVKRKYPAALSVSGYGAYLRKIIRKEHLSKHVTMLGRLSGSRMKEQMLKANVFCCPSVLENSPNAMCEAMLLGTPVVAAKVGGVPSLITDGEEGILFPSGKVDELAEGIKTFFYEPELGRILGGAAARRARVTHNPDTNFKRLIGIYRSIVSS